MAFSVENCARRAPVTAPGGYSFPGRQGAPALAVLVAAMLGAAPALADPPAASLPPPGPAATFTPTVEDPYGPPGTAMESPAGESAPGAPGTPPASSASSASPEVAPAQAPPAAARLETTIQWTGGAPPWTVPAAPGASYPGALPEPRRSPERIAGGITLTVLGAGGIGTGLALLFTSIASGVMGGNNWQGLVVGGLGGLGLGGLGLGVGIPLLRSGSRKIVRESAGGQLWIAPSTLTLSF